MEFLKISKNETDIIKRVWTLRVPRELNALPRCQIRVDILFNFFYFDFNRLNFVRHIHLRLLRDLVQCD